MKTPQDLYQFILVSIKGLVDHEEKVDIQAIESGQRTVTFLIKCETNDLKFIYPRMNSIKFIAFAIARKHNALVNILLDEEAS